MALSYSGMSTFKKCAKKFFYSYIERLPRTPMDPNSAGGRGLEIHQTVEDYTNRKCEHLHEDIHEHYGQYFFTLREQGLEAEVKWAITTDWEPCDFDDEDAMLRGVMDGILKPNVYEYKTGKFYPEHFDQMLLYGFIQLLKHPDIDTVDVTALYFDNKAHRTITYYRTMFDNYQKAFYTKIMEIHNEEIYAANPSWLCKWCDFSKEKGGPCQF